MTGKQIKFYETLFDFARTDYLSNPKAYFEFIEYSADYDFATGAQLWEYLFVANERTLDEECCDIFSIDSFNVFFSKSEQKSIRLLTDNPTLMRALFQYHSEGLDAQTLKILLDFILGTKISAADEALRALSKNTVCPKGFGALMKELMDRLFVEILKRIGGGKAVLTRKQTELLLTHISRIKTNEKALLVQRLKEIS